jgi:predicted dehydrogenase
MRREGDLRLGLAGCGRIAELGYVPAALATPGVQIAALADPDPGRLRRCGELWEHGGGDEASGFAGAEELLASAAIDVLVVASPAADHPELAAQAAAAGVLALVEKPPAADLEGALLLAELQPEPLIAFNRRFLQGVELRDSIPAEGWLELDLELRYRRDAWGAHEARDEALLDAGVHLIDLAAFLCGAAPICVRRAAVEPERAHFELELGRGRARIACATDRRHRESVEVRDRAGRTLARSALGGFRGRLQALRGAPHPVVLSLSRQLAALHERLRGGGKAEGAASTPALLAGASDGVAAMGAVEAARRSAALGGAEVTVALPAERTA